MNKIQTIVDKSTNAIELNLLLLCLRIYLRTESAAHLSKYIYNNSCTLRWPVFFELCVIHRVYPVILKVIKSQSAVGVPPEIITQLEQQRAIGLRQSMLLAAETVRVVALLEANDINVIVLKGAALALNVYGDIGMRPTRDVDILVNRNDAAKACGLVKELGYQPHFGVFSSNSTVKQQSFLCKMYHHEEFYGANYSVEIHWDIQRWIDETTNFEKMFFESDKLILSDRTIHGVGAAALFDYLATHGASHGWCRLRWLLDIALLFQQKQGNDLPKDTSFSDFSHQALILVHCLLGVPIDCKILEHITAKQTDIANKATGYFVNYSGDLPATFSREYFIYLDYVLRIYFKRNYLLNFIFVFFSPNSLDFRAVSLPDKMFWLYYPLKPFIWIVRAINSWRTGKKA